MSEVRYTKEHEWVHAEAGVGTVGITDHAQKELGDIVFVELPKIGAHVEQGKTFAVVESVKAASDIFAPVSGEVVAINDAVQATTSLINEDAQGRGWLFQLKLSDPSEVDGCLGLAAPSEHPSGLRA